MEIINLQIRKNVIKYRHLESTEGKKIWYILSKSLAVIFFEVRNYYDYENEG